MPPQNKASTFFFRIDALYLQWPGCGVPSVLPAVYVAFATVLPERSPEKEPIDQLFSWLLREGGDLHEIPFSKVIVDATGKRVLAIDPKNEADQRVIKQICEVLDEVMKAHERVRLPLQNVARINEGQQSLRIPTETAKQPLRPIPISFAFSLCL